MPILSWLPRYNVRWLQMDLLAGITVGLTTVPQALAYAEVAGLPVEVINAFSPPFLIAYLFIQTYTFSYSAFFER